jgi:predicted SAM-dependent methyltransferase
MELLNLGCGNRYNTSWTNIDFNSTGHGVMAYNLTKGIPFEKETFDVVYHSNVIEHFSKDGAIEFIKECFRVLRPNGVIRIAYPDLEKIILHYFRILNEIKNNSQLKNDYDWIMLELFDQTVRNYSGGYMLKYFIRDSIPNEDFVISRCGKEAEQLIENGRNIYLESLKKPLQTSNFIKIKRYIKRKLKSENIFNREYLIKKILSKDDYNALQIGRFRLGGEIHQWMYDSYSMSNLLDFIGFKKIIQRDAFTSYINNWQDYNLDTEPDGGIYKPDSSYIEAIK